MSWKVLIADDERAARKKISSFLKEYPQVTEILEAARGDRALELIRQHQPDLVFLDIQMPGLSGLEVAREALELSHHLVFVSAYDQYALSAFEAQAVDYLLKPLSATRFQQTMQRILQKTMPAPQAVDWDRLMQQVQGLYTSRTLAIKSGGSLLVLESRHIALCTAENGISRVELLPEGAKLHGVSSLYCDLSLSELLTRLPATEFIQVHRSYLVNLRQIRAIHPDGRSHFLQLKDLPRLRIPVSRQHYPQLQKYIGSL